MNKAMDISHLIPAGLLTANLDLDPQYPGVDIKIDGELIARVEQHPFFGLRTIAYNKECDEPINIINWEDKNEPTR